MSEVKRNIGRIASKVGKEVGQVVSHALGISGTQLMNELVFKDSEAPHLSLPDKAKVAAYCILFENLFPLSVKSATAPLRDAISGNGETHLDNVPPFEHDPHRKAKLVVDIGSTIALAELALVDPSLASIGVVTRNLVVYAGLRVDGSQQMQIFKARLRNAYDAFKLPPNLAK